MILHHGTYINFDNIDLSKSNKGTDLMKTMTTFTITMLFMVLLPTTKLGCRFVTY